MNRDIDLSLLRAFLAVAQTGGMTSAGRHLNLTQAAVSQQIKRLEEQMGRALFDRSQRRLKLTASGERLMGHAERILTLNDEIWSTMTAPEFTGRIRLGVPHDIVGPFMPPILRNFSKAWSRVEVTLNCSSSQDLLRYLSEGELDLTITTDPEPAEGDLMLLADRLVWTGAPNGTAHLRDPLPVSLGDENCAFRSAAVRALSGAGRDWLFTCTVSNMSALGAAIEADLSVAPLLSQTVPAGLKVLDADSGLPPLPTYYVNLHMSPGRPSKIASELAYHITRSFALRYPQAA